MVDVVRNGASSSLAFATSLGAALRRGVSSPDDSLYEENALSTRVAMTLAMQSGLFDGRADH